MADTDIAKIGVKLTVDGAEEAGKKIEDVGKKGKKTEGDLKDLSKSANKTGGPFRAMRGSMQQVSWQLQDVAVQSQMGTDKLMILGQQGPQLASVFGPGGAVVGALIAFGSVLAGVVINSLGGASQELKALEEQTKQNADAFDDLTEAQQRVITIDTIKKIEAQKKLLKDFNQELATARKKGPNIEVIASEGGPSVDISETEEEFANRLVAIQAKADTAKQMIGLYKNSIDDLRTDTEKLIDKLKEQERVTAKTTEQIIKSSEAYTKATPKQKEEILLRAQNVETLKREKLAKDEAIAVEQKAGEEKALFIANLDKQHNLMTLTGQDLYEYQAIQAGATGEDIKSVAAKIELIATTKAQIKADAELVKAKAKIAADALKSGDQAQKLMQEIEQANMTELEQLSAQLTAKGGLLAQFLEQDHITLDQYLAMDAELQKTYDLAEIKANDEKNKKILEDDKALAEAKIKIQQEVLAGVSGVIGQLADAAEEGSSEAKALFAIEKAIAIATTVMNAEVAAVAAMAAMPGPPGVLMGNVIRGIGYASAGIIAGTAIAGGRALGGQVRGGESYLVGERGPELLTMGTSGRIATNENLKNAVGGDSGSGVTINQTINVTTGIQSTVRAEIVQLMPQIAQAAKGAVADGRQRGGNFSRAMSGA